MNRLNKEQQTVRNISFLFSRRMYEMVLRSHNISPIRNALIECGQDDLIQLPLSQTIRKAYNLLAKYYRCEYLYKNELLNQLLLKKYGTLKTIAFNEFKIGDSIADITMFNGESKAFEIKSDLDSPFRLSGQMFDYTRLFQKCYIVVPENETDKYIESIGQNIGVILLKRVKRHIELEEYRSAVPNDYIDPDLVMRCLHTKEYMHLVKTYFDRLPDVSIFEMFDECSKRMKSISSQDLQKLFLKEIESRHNATSRLCYVQKELRQLCLCMNMSNKEIAVMNQYLKQPLN